VCDLGTLAASASKVVAITIEAGLVAPIQNRVRVTSGEGDLNDQNNQSTVQTDVVARVCSPRPPVSIVVNPTGVNTLSESVSSQTSTTASNNRIGVLSFGPPPSNSTPMSNALIDIDGQGGRTGHFNVPLRRWAATSFTVTRPQAAVASFVPFVVVDD